MNYKEIEPYHQNLIDLVTKHFPSCRLYLFGSRATQTNTPHSDIDLAIDCGQEIPSRDLSELTDAIDTLNIPFCVDVVDIHNTSPIMVEQINKYGILWKK
ncbi:nucleotidyltransferase domain-containing protein [Candidatus Babeliales bacterium]|nr:nucleotidyltransferase domain-containing protein [Candidatus Babeliales bacterium]MBY0353405.1 nucleotidyltransferase domain-containing protein [Candidatus Babeliales bacterium]